MFHIRIKVSTTHMLVYFFFHTYVSNSYIGFFSKSNRMHLLQFQFFSQFHHHIFHLYSIFKTMGKAFTVCDICCS